MIADASLNIASHLPAMAAAQPDTLAVRMPTRRGNYTDWTYRQLDAESDRIARGLRDIGITPGTRTVLMVSPSLEFFALVFALFKAGAAMVAVDPGMGVRNLKTCLAEAEPQAFIGIARAHVARRLLGWAKATNRINVLVGPRRSWTGMHTLESVRRAGDASDEPVMHTPGVDESAAILFTSGSTGIPKGAVYTHGNFQAQVAALRQAYDIQSGEIDLCTFPLFALYAPALGMTAIVPRMDFTRPGGVDPAAIIEPIQRFGVTNLFGSPALLRRITEPGVDSGKLPSLRRVISAGAPVPPSVIRRVVALLEGDAKVHTPYGATECLPVATNDSDVILNETAVLTEQGRGVCVGPPVPSIDARIICITDRPIDQWSDSLQVPIGEIGEIVVRGPQATRAYHNRDASTALAKIPCDDGAVFHRMGDLGYFDERGRLWMCGRKSQRVRLDQGDLYTVPCEAVFNTHEQVSRSALVAVDGEPVIVVELAGNAPAADAMLADLQRIAESHEHTRPIRRFLIYPKAFPVDIRHNAKINREKLAHWAARAQP